MATNSTRAVLAAFDAVEPLDLERSLRSWVDGGGVSAAFKELAIGETFDFIGPDLSLVSFWYRCQKSGPRTYRALKLGGTALYRVGTVSVRVYHVEDAPEVAL